MINARELHEFLEDKQQFANWISNRIKKYGFIEGTDFLIILLESTGGRPATEYYLNLDVAKEIAMIQNNEKGRIVRRYFIEVEKKYRDHLFHELEEIKAMDKQVIEAKKLSELVAIEADMTKSLIRQYVSYGFKRNDISLHIHKTRMANGNPHDTVYQLLKDRRDRELTIKRGRINVRMQGLGNLYKEIYGNEHGDPYEFAWHILADELRYELGHNVNWRKRHAQDKANVDKFNATRKDGIKSKKYPSYLDYIEEDDCHKQAETVVNKLIKQAQRILDKKNSQKEIVVDDLRGIE